jgi:hypothetical protein
VKETDTDNQTSFKGTFIKRQYKPGQNYVQLLFESKAGPRLALCSDVEKIRSLQAGENYKVEGPEYTNGTKTFVNEPDFTQVAGSGGMATAIWLSFGMVLLFIVVPGTVVAYKFRFPGQAVKRFDPTSIETNLEKTGKVHPLLNTAKDEALTESRSETSAEQTPPAENPAPEQPAGRATSPPSTQNSSQSAQSSQTQAPPAPPPDPAPYVPPPPPPEEPAPPPAEEPPAETPPEQTAP